MGAFIVAAHLAVYGVLGAIIVYLIAQRRREKASETFEDRDN